MSTNKLAGVAANFTRLSRGGCDRLANNETIGGRVGLDCRGGRGDGGEDEADGCGEDGLKLHNCDLVEIGIVRGTKYVGCWDSVECKEFVCLR